MDASDHGKVVLGAILGGQSIKALEYAQTRLTAEHFVDHVQFNLFVLAQRYADQTRGVLRREALADLLRNEDPGTALMYQEYFDALARSVPEVDQFRHSVSQLRELAAERATGDALAHSMRILREGVRDERGHELRGADDARAYAMGALSEVDRDAGLIDSPEGNVFTESAEIMARYAAAKEARLKGTAAGIEFGIPELDAKLPGGLGNGEVLIVVGWVSAGKTAWCVQQAWHASVIQGKNVVYLTTETLRPQINNRLVSRHSRLPQFGLPQGINERDLRSGRLDERGERALQRVLHDFGANPSYGRCWTVQVPKRGTIASCEARLTALSRQFHIDLVIIDYLALLYPEVRRRDSDMRQDMAGIFKEAKQLAATFHDGEGVPLISPWQLNREGRKVMKDTGVFGLENLSETQEAGATADLVFGLVDPITDTSRGRSVPEELGVLKNRGGERNFSVRLTADFATSTFASRDRTTSEESLLGA